MMPTLLRAAALVTTAIVCVVAIAEETTEVAIDKLKFTVPKSWTKEEPSNSLRLAQWKIPAAAGDSEPGEFYITPPIGGTAKQNIDRWIGQFDAKDRTTKMTKGTSSQGEYVIVELSGTYNKPDGPPILRKTTPVAGYRMYGVILTVNGGGNYFMKLTGPDKTVSAQSDALRASFGGKASAESEYKQE
jgi:gluconolactonase